MAKFVASGNYTRSRGLSRKPTPAALKNAQAVLSRNVGAQQEILRRDDSNLRLKNFPAFTREFWDWRESDLASPLVTVMVYVLLPGTLCASLFATSVCPAVISELFAAPTKFLTRRGLDSANLILPETFTLARPTATAKMFCPISSLLEALRLSEDD
jgi:hypothetical protein